MKKIYKQLQLFSYIYYASVLTTLAGSLYPFIQKQRYVSADEFANTDLNAFVQDFFPWALGISGGLAIVMLIYSGYLYVTSAGNVEQVNKAKEFIVGALSGLAFLMLAVLIYRSLQS